MRDAISRSHSTYGEKGHITFWFGNLTGRDKLAEQAIYRVDDIKMDH
jgi:hypothetical protein